MSRRSTTIPIGKKAIVTNNGDSPIWILTGPSRVPCRELKPGGEEMVINSSQTEELIMEFQDEGQTTVEIVDIDDC